MVFRIIRGALVGIVLGLLMGVGLSGAMYMFNYMRTGGDWEISEGTAIDDGEAGFVVNTDDGKFVPTLSNGVRLRNSYDSKELVSTLNTKGINGLARELAQDNWGLGQQNQEGEYTENGKPDVETEEEDILGNNLIRFHVRANSNSDVDIALKYKVRDAVLSYLEDGLRGCTTREEAKAYLTDNLEPVKEVAEEALWAEGFNYEVESYLTNDYFPIRQYGDMVIPAGYYEALRIDIGLANGENFWCLLYPTMCVPIEAGGVVTKEGQREISKELNEEQFDKLFVKKEVPKENIEIRFKLFELLFGDN